MFKWWSKIFSSQKMASISNVINLSYTPVDYTPVHYTEVLSDFLTIYQQNHIHALHDFMDALNSKELIGYYIDELDKNENSIFYTHYAVNLLTKDNMLFSISLWSDNCNSGKQLLSFYAYKIIRAIMQGDLFNNPTILCEAEKNCVISNYVTYTSPHLNTFSSGDEHIKSVMNNTVAHVKQLVAALPVVTPEHIMASDFHKLWEQLPLTLDIGTEMTKL